MLKLLRVDDRLIHGQVTFSWLSATGAKRIIVANDKFATNKMLKMSLTVGKPSGVDLQILEKSKAISLIKAKGGSKTMLIVKDIQDAYDIYLGLKDDLHDICLGGVREEPGRKLVAKQVYLSEDDIKLLQEMVNAGKNVFAQDVPIVAAASFDEIISKFNER